MIDFLISKSKNFYYFYYFYNINGQHNDSYIDNLTFGWLCTNPAINKNKSKSILYGIIPGANLYSNF